MFRAHTHIKFLRVSSVIWLTPWPLIAAKINRFSAQISFMFKRFENDVRVRIFTVRFLKNSFYISLYIYWLAMIFYVLGCPTYP